jgi:hypothetical protein
LERRYTRIDEVCKTHKTAVEEEVKKILGIQDPEMSAQAYFEKRTAAAKNVYENMNEVEKKKVDDEVARGKRAPNEPAVQQRWVKPI